MFEVFGYCEREKLRSKRREDVKAVVGGKVMTTNNQKAENLANGLMTRLVRVTREYLVLERRSMSTWLHGIP
ncbi:hypothetical protein CAEBREN_23779 [Caenorhabditis brenneri]|uniref:Uncharacterized protein n=1 Tax=Caenorhabditis brenneri TaxID=135651 RepID=G0PGT6_CAEBE|nr:hypothetical protein CAEBREN_23779 [Caenorhabditis brenneri]